MNKSIPLLYLGMACTLAYSSLAARFGFLDFFGLEFLSTGETVVLALFSIGVTAWGFILIVGSEWTQDWRTLTAKCLFLGYIATFIIAFLVQEVFV